MDGPEARDSPVNADKTDTEENREARVCKGKMADRELMEEEDSQVNRYLSCCYVQITSVNSGS